MTFGGVHQQVAVADRWQKQMDDEDALDDEDVAIELDLNDRDPERRSADDDDLDLE